MYNLKNDIGEANNLCNQEIAKRDELLNELLTWIDETNAPIPKEPNGDFSNNPETTNN
ncbi:MAG: hypothetical protein ACFHWX_08475 [Bacteroidota bacterium]